MQATMTTAAEAVKAIIGSKPDADVRVTRRIEIGSIERQGDVYLHAVEADHPHGKPLGTRQVAVGTSIGSRHIARGDGVEVFAGEKMPPWVKAPKHAEDKAAWAKEMLGPVVVASGPWALTHPEHAHHQLPAGCYQVTYQADEQTGRRVRD